MLGIDSRCQRTQHRQQRDEIALTLRTFNFFCGIGPGTRSQCLDPAATERLIERSRAVMSQGS